MSLHLSEQEAREAWDYWYPLVYGFFYRRVGNRIDVEELTASTITALLLKEDVQNPKAFIWQTAKNQLIEYIKQKNKTPTIVNLDSLFGLEVESEEQEQELIAAKWSSTSLDDSYSDHFLQKVEQLKKCIQTQVKEQDYQIVMASLIYEKNSTQISQETGIKPATVRQKLRRAISKIKKSCFSLWQEIYKRT